MMLAARKGLPGHVVYGRVRNAMELLERHRGAAAAAEALVLADLVEAVGPGTVMSESVASRNTTWKGSRVRYDGSYLYTGMSYRAHRVHSHQISLKESGWLSDALVGEWCGVTTDPENGGVVTRLDLRNMGLRGNLPPSLTTLENVEVLDLTGNDALSLGGVPLTGTAGADEDWSRASGLPLDKTSGQPHYATREQCAAALEVIGMNNDQRTELKQRRYYVVF